MKIQYLIQVKYEPKNENNHLSTGRAHVLDLGNSLAAGDDSLDSRWSVSARLLLGWVQLPATREADQSREEIMSVEVWRNPQT